MTKRVCIIHENISFGGMEVHTAALMRTLIQGGYIIDFISNRQSSFNRMLDLDEFKDSVNVLRADLHGITDPIEGDAKRWREFLKLVPSNKLILPKGLNDYGSFGFLWECRKRFRDITYIEHLEPDPIPKMRGTLHFGFIPGVGLWRHKALFRRRARSFFADRIVAVSQKLKQTLIQHCGYPARKVFVASNGIDWRALASVAASRTEVSLDIRQTYGIRREGRVFGMLVRLNQQKAIDIALRALAHLISMHPEGSFTLAIAGDGEEKQALMQLADQLNLGSRAVFLGFVDHPRELLAAFDFIVFSSRNEGLPLGLLEAMSAGCVPIVTRIGGMPEVVSGPEIGWVVDPNSPLALAKAMTAALSLPDTELRRRSMHAQMHVQRHFDITQSNERIMAICGL